MAGKILGAANFETDLQLETLALSPEEANNLLKRSEDMTRGAIEEITRKTTQDSPSLSTEELQKELEEFKRCNPLDAITKEEVARDIERAVARDRAETALIVLRREMADSLLSLTHTLETRRSASFEKNEMGEIIALKDGELELRNLKDSLEWLAPALLRDDAAEILARLEEIKSFKSRLDGIIQRCASDFSPAEIKEAVKNAGEELRQLQPS